MLPREALLTIYKSFIRPHFDVIYDQSYNDLFHAELESYQHKAALALTGAMLLIDHLLRSFIKNYG